MRLRYRPSSEWDLRHCTQLCTCRTRYGKLFEPLRDVWPGLLRKQSLISSAVEDLDAGSEDRLLALGVSVFLADEFVRYAKTPPLFWIGPELVRRILQNDSPILDLSAIRRANSSDGLNLFVWEVDIRPVGEAEFLAVGTRLTRAFFEHHAGFRLKEVMGQHPFGRVLRAAVQVGGWLVHGQSGEYIPVHDSDAIERAARPFVLGLTRELAHEHPGSWLSTLFDYTPPLLFLTLAEQRQINAGLKGKTDEEIAGELAISTSAVKKCWQSIYAKAAVRLPELLPDHTCELLSKTVRGAEKKRRLLVYLRDHPAELRPILQPSARTSRRTAEKPRRKCLSSVARS